MKIYVNVEAGEIVDVAYAPISDDEPGSRTGRASAFSRKVA
jgi:hypothetical protein